MNLISKAVLVALTLTGAGCAPEVDVEAARADLLRTDRDWAVAASAGTHVDLIVSYWSDHAVIIPPEAPDLRGKDAIREFVAGSMEIPGFAVSWEPSEVVVSPSGDMGYTAGSNQFTVPDADGTLVTIPGRYVTVWQKQADGAWKCVMDIWNTEPAGEADQG